MNAAATDGCKQQPSPTKRSQRSTKMQLVPKTMMKRAVLDEENLASHSSLPIDDLCFNSKSKMQAVRKSSLSRAVSLDDQNFASVNSLPTDDFSGFRSSAHTHKSKQGSGCSPKLRSSSAIDDDETEEASFTVDDQDWWKSEESTIASAWCAPQQKNIIPTNIMPTPLSKHLLQSNDDATVTETTVTSSVVTPNTTASDTSMENPAEKPAEKLAEKSEEKNVAANAERDSGKQADKRRKTRRISLTPADLGLSKSLDQCDPKELEEAMKKWREAQKKKGIKDEAGVSTNHRGRRASHDGTIRMRSRSRARRSSDKQPKCSEDDKNQEPVVCRRRRSGRHSARQEHDEAEPASQREVDHGERASRSSSNRHLKSLSGLNLKLSDISGVDTDPQQEKAYNADDEDAGSPMRRRSHSIGPQNKRSTRSKSRGRTQKDCKTGGRMDESAHKKVQSRCRGKSVGRNRQIKKTPTKESPSKEETGPITAQKEHECGGGSEDEMKRAEAGIRTRKSTRSMSLGRGRLTTDIV